MNSDLIQRLQEWYLEQCNGDWEHTYGVKIGTLDNPGWTVKVDLRDTYLEERPFEKINVSSEDKNDWNVCWVEKQVFHAACGPLKLGDAIQIFLNWAREG